MGERPGDGAPHSEVARQIEALRARRTKLAAQRHALGRLRGRQLEKRQVLRHEGKAGGARDQGEVVRLDGPAGALIGAAPVGICVLDEAGTFAQVNGAYAALLGYRPDELVGRPFTAIYPPEAWEVGLATFRRALAEGAPYAAERSLRRKDGTPVVVQATAIPVVGPGGRMQLAVFAVDIEGRKRAEEAQAHLAALVASTSDAVVGGTPDGTITIWNAGAERLYGYTAAEAVGRSVGMLAIPGGPDAAAPRALHAALRRGEAIVDLDTLRRRKDGSAVPVSISAAPVRDGSGEIAGIVGFHRDMSARKAAEEGLARAKAELETLFRVLPIGIGVAEDPAVRRIRMNPAAARQLGLPPGANASLGAPEGERPTSFRVLQGGRELALEELPFNVAATGREVRDLELEVVREDGARVTQLVNAAPLFDEGGRVRGVVGAYLDISARVLAERQRDLLLAGLAHDLKNPVSALIWLAEALQRRATEPEEVRLLERFVGGARQILTQINELVDAAQGQLGRPLALDLRRVDLAALVGRLPGEQAELGRHRRVVVAGTHAPLEGLCDEGRLGRALANVLGNAIKYSAPGGEVTVSLSQAEERAGGWATIRVADRGIGIPAAEVGRVFEPFFRASNARGRAEGSGLGLAGVRQVVEAHGGSVALASEEGVGTVVTIRLPLRPPGLPGAAEEAR